MGAGAPISERVEGELACPQGEWVKSPCYVCKKVGLKGKIYFQPVEEERKILVDFWMEFGILKFSQSFGGSVTKGIFLGFSVILVLSNPILAWDGYDYEKGSYIEIERGNLVRSGGTIEIYDYGDGSYHDVEVEDINRSGTSVEIEVYDNETGEYRAFEMD